MAVPFPRLFSPLSLRGTVLRNRIFSTGHGTHMLDEGLPSEQLTAYHAARAAGGAALIIVEAAAVHETGVYGAHVIAAHTDACIAGYRRLAEAVHAYDCKLFGQLYHPGRAVPSNDTADGSAPVCYAPSAMPDERHHVVPRPMSIALIRDVIEGYAAAALRMKAAGLDGVEIMVNQGYLPAQFLNPRLNRRADAYGGSAGKRLQFLVEVAEAVRACLGDEMVVGIRISGDELDHQGLTAAESRHACTELDRLDLIDFADVVAGSAATLGSAIHIVPPTPMEPAYTAPVAGAIRAELSKPVFVAGRITTPHTAERVLAAGQADMCGMARALICDPELPSKALSGREEDVRECIGCNQACSGHGELGVPISCIQYPESGRERLYGQRRRAPRRRKVLVAGGGPAGMKAAAVAAARGHHVSLYERSRQLGGQVLLAQLLPDRSEFGAMVSNLSREAERAGVAVRRLTEVTRAVVEREAPDCVVLATGAEPYWPVIEGQEEGHVVDAWQVLRGETTVGSSVVVADWRCDWIGMGLAEKLALEGCRVRLCVNGYMPGQHIQRYVRDRWAGELHKLGVEVINYARLFGVDAGSVYFQHTTSGEPIVCEEADTLVLATGHRAVNALEAALAGYDGEVRLAGDCLVPRTAEEAVLEGLQVASAI